MEQLVSELYSQLSDPASFGSVDTIYDALHSRGISVSKEKIRDILHSLDTYTTYYKRTKKTPRMFAHAPTIDWMWHSDSAYMLRFSFHNRGAKFATIFVDVLSYYCFIRPLTALRARNMAVLLEQLFESTGRHPTILYTDMGSEWIGAQTKQVLATYDIQHTFPNSLDNKAFLAENCIKRFKTLFHKWRAATGRTDWINFIPQFEHHLNNVYNKKRKGSPMVIDILNQSIVANNLLNQLTPHPPPKLAKGDKVKIRIHKAPMAKGYEQSYTKEHYIITKVRATKPATYYLKSALDGEPISRWYYSWQLVKITDKPEV